MRTSPTGPQGSLPRDLTTPHPFPSFATFVEARERLRMWEKINQPISYCCRRGLSLIAFRRSVSIRCSNRFFRLTVDDQDTIGFLKPETSVGEKKSLSESEAGPQIQEAMRI